MVEKYIVENFFIFFHSATKKAKAEEAEKKNKNRRA